MKQCDLRPAADSSLPLEQRRCAACEGGIPPLLPEQVDGLLSRLGGGWEVTAGHRLQRELRFADFAEALAFANQVGALAEREGHHPELLVAWGLVRVTLWTHAVADLTENDFVLAAKIGKLSEASQRSDSICG